MIAEWTRIGGCKQTTVTVTFDVLQAWRGSGQKKTGKLRDIFGGSVQFSSFRRSVFDSRLRGC